MEATLNDDDEEEEDKEERMVETRSGRPVVVVVIVDPLIIIVVDRVVSNGSGSRWRRKFGRSCNPFPLSFRRVFFVQPELARGGFLRTSFPRLLPRGQTDAVGGSKFSGLLGDVKSSNVMTLAPWPLLLAILCRNLPNILESQEVFVRPSNDPNNVSCELCGRRWI